MSEQQHEVTGVSLITIFVTIIAAALVYELYTYFGW